MQRTDLAETFCPAARALACVGEWWSLLILRDVLQGLRRFEEIRDSLGISTNILARRLQHLTENGILARRLYQQRPARHEYVPTEKGRELFPLLLLLYRWGNAYETPEGIAVELADRATGQALDPVVVDRLSGKVLALDQVKLRTGPAATPAAIERVELIATLRARAAQTKSARAKSTKTRSEQARSAQARSAQALSVQAAQPASTRSSSKPRAKQMMAATTAEPAKGRAAKALPAKTHVARAHATKTHPAKTRKQPAASNAGNQRKHRKRASS